jgi:hypothetical protein
MDIEKLINLYGDKICFWGEIDRQYTCHSVQLMMLKKQLTGLLMQYKKRTGNAQEHLHSVSGMRSTHMKT